MPAAGGVVLPGDADAVNPGGAHPTRAPTRPGLADPRLRDRAGSGGRRPGHLDGRVPHLPAAAARVSWAVGLVVFALAGWGLLWRSRQRSGDSPRRPEVTRTADDPAARTDSSTTENVLVAPAVEPGGATPTTVSRRSRRRELAWRWHGPRRWRCCRRVAWSAPRPPPMMLRTGAGGRWSGVAEWLRVDASPAISRSSR